MEKKGFVEEICTILENNKVISAEGSQDLKKSFAHRSSVVFDDFLLEEGLVEKEDLLHALSIYYQVPAMDPIGYFFDHQLVIKFPKNFLIRNLIIPLEVIDNMILVVIANDPSDEELLPKIGRYVSYDIQFMVAIASDIIESVEEFYDESLTELKLDENEEVENEEIQEDIRDIEEND